MPRRRTFFKFFPADFWADDKVQVMTGVDVGCFLKLLSHQWEYGKVPISGVDRRQLLMSLIGHTNRYPEIWRKLSPCFVQNDAGDGLINPRLKREYNEMLASKDRERERWRKRKTPENTRATPPESGVESVIDVLDEEDDKNKSRSSRLKNARVGAQGTGDSPNLSWNTESEAIAAARLVSMEKGSGEYMSALVVRNAIDCFHRRGAARFRNAKKIFYGRVARGKTRLEEFGGKHHERALEIVKEWRL